MGLRELFQRIANAIRSKTGSNVAIKATDFPQAIADIETTPEGWHDTREVNATAADVLSPKKIVDANGNVLTGSIVPQGAGTYAAKLNETRIIETAGKYYSGNQTISGITLENLTAANIRNGVTVKVKSGGSEIASIAGSFTGNVKVLTKSPSQATDSWLIATGGNAILPYLTFTTNEVGFVPDAIIAVSSGQVFHTTTWTRGSYQGAPNSNYFVFAWRNDAVWWKNQTAPSSMSSTEYRIPVTIDHGNRSFYVFFMKA